MLPRRVTPWLILTAILVTPASAQHHGGHTPASPPAAVAPSPYAGMTRRAVQALSDQQMADLQAGRGMGLALPAELNGYPGPSHVLEQADALGLSDEQRALTSRLHDEMKAETIGIGARVIAEEIALDQIFANKRATRAALDQAVERAGAAHADLRAAHLRYHLAMIEVLSPAQVTQYGVLRGYDVGSDPRH